MTPKKYVVRIFGTKRDGAKYNGTGFLLNSSGYVATCWHVVEEAKDILVKLPLGEEWIYDVFAKREQEDVAVLRGHLKPGVETGHATLHPEWFDADKEVGGVVMWGYSNPNADGPLPFECKANGVTSKYGLIMLDGHVNEGDSGGPILNAAGDVIGIANYKDTKREGQAMARPISRLYKLLVEEKIPANLSVGSGGLAEQALQSLSDRTDQQQVREAVQADGDIFTTSSSQISSLHVYKKVHDLLHEVEFYCYNSLVEVAESFPDKEWAQNQMRFHVSHLREHVLKADLILAEATENVRLIAKVRDQLAEACDALQEAVDWQDPEPCKDAVNVLRLLLTGPAQAAFNRFLKDVARELNMNGLGAAMQRVQAVIPRAELPSDTAHEFTLGLNDLAELDKELHARTKEHDSWQRIDDILRSFNNNSSDLLRELELLRPHLTSDIRTVCNLSRAAERGSMSTGTASDWATRLMYETMGLEQAVFAGDPEGARNHLGELRIHAALRFKYVDHKLLQVCAKISKMNPPLRSLVEKS